VAAAKSAEVLATVEAAEVLATVETATATAVETATAATVGTASIGNTGCGCRRQHRRQWNCLKELEFHLLFLSDSNERLDRLEQQ
jgi:hypothetical protein